MERLLEKLRVSRYETTDRERFVCVDVILDRVVLYTWDES